MRRAILFSTTTFASTFFSSFAFTQSDDPPASEVVQKALDEQKTLNNKLQELVAKASTQADEAEAKVVEIETLVKQADDEAITAAKDEAKTVISTLLIIDY